MSTEQRIREAVEQAGESVGPAWPLHSFVTANPLAGFEGEPFHEAVRRGRQLFDGDGYPDPDVFRHAWASGRIDEAVLTERLDEHGYDSDPEASLARMGTPGTTRSTVTATDRVDAVLTKWLAAFLDEGRADWPMPDREAGFYAAFRAVAGYDSEIPDRGVVTNLPDRPVETIDRVVASSGSRLQSVLERHLTSLPGWAGFVKQRGADGGQWASACPITLVEYLAVRLALVDAFDAPVDPSSTESDPDGVPPEAVWLRAWEASYRDELVDAVSDSASDRSDDGGRPDAQLVFCIDTRSEIIRRHIEATGNYETHGYAGFFGVPMRYRGYDSGVTVDACPPIVDPQHRIVDRPTAQGATRDRYDTWTGTVEAGRDLVESLTSNAATAFSFVESAGLGYGAALAARTLLPTRVYDILDTADDGVPDEHEFCDPDLTHDPDADGTLQTGLTFEQQVEYAATAFDLMGIETFARVVVFAGHASQTANNPFDASLDCGACAGNPGGPSARVLAAICNSEQVTDALRERGFDIPADTVFVAGQHNTTTDEVTLFTADVPGSHEADIEHLREDLATARAGAASERAGDMGADTGSGVRETERRAADWSETRPEWGLAGNAALVVGPRELTSGLDLDGRCFLHSYDWQTDPEGETLAAIVAGPMVVTQWINTQYYFATVDSGVYGSGSKVTHNPVGNVGVYQGNGGDLMTGLPLQSVKTADDRPYHQPLRLSTVIHAPRERVTAILAENEHVTRLLDNNWLSLTVVDPTRDQRPFLYDGNLSWTACSGSAAAEPATGQSSPTVDD